MAKIWKDHTGAVVPVRFVPAIDKAKDKAALKIFKKAEDVHNRLALFKMESFKMMDDIFNLVLTDAKVKKERKGYFSITTFDKLIKIEITISEHIKFNEYIELAQSKINEFIDKRTDGVDQDLSVLVQSAFSTSKGRLDTKRILGLFQLNIKSKLWLEAMDLIKKSITRDVTKRHIHVYYKNPENSEAKYQEVKLNLSSI